MSTLTQEKSKSVQRPKPARRAPQKQRDFVTQDAMLTTDDWLALPDTKPRYELIDGKLIQRKLKTFSQVYAAGEFLVQAMNWGNRCEWQFLIEGVGVRIDSYNGFIPNLLGFSPHQKITSADDCVTAPFLAIEISASKSDTTQLRRKRELYAVGGVQLYLIIDTANRTLEVFRLQENNVYGQPEVLGEKDVWQPSELPGLQLELKNLWMN